MALRNMSEKLPECKNLLSELSDSVVDISTIGSGDDDDVLSKENAGTEHIQVFLRIRPLSTDDRSQGLDDGCILVESDRTVIVAAPRMSHAFRSSTYGLSRQRQRFTFSHVFPPETLQKQFFDDTVHSMISDFVSGQNSLIFTYGVTNSGKTYTIQGDAQQSNAGILPRSLDVIFNRISGRQCASMAFKPAMFGDVVRLGAEQIQKEQKLKQSILSRRSQTPDTGDERNMDTGSTVASHEMSDDSLESRSSLINTSSTSALQSDENNVRFLLWASFAEIYNEQVYDLLDSVDVSGTRTARSSALQVRDDRDGRPYIRGLREVAVMNAEEARQLIQIGRENQHIAATRLNRMSSRSHSIFTLRLVQVVDVDQPNVARVAALSFCDLAGSERYTSTCGYNERVKEAGNINSSLLTLGRCIGALRKNQAQRDLSSARASVVPFRESKLTRLFQNFLCGEGRVVMIINVSQLASVFDETLHAMKYSALARQVVVGPPVGFTDKVPQFTAPEKRKVSVQGKREATTAGAPKTAEKKRKFTLDQMPEEPDEDEDDGSDSEDDGASDAWEEQRQKYITAIKMLQKALADERQAKAEQEARIRAEVCAEMRKQLVRIEEEYQEGIRKREEIWEEKYERKMELYMEAVQKSCKRQKRTDNEEEFVSCVELHAAETKAGKYADQIHDLETKLADLQEEMAATQSSFQKVSSERNALTERLTKAEFAASDAEKKLSTLREQTASRSGSDLQKTVEELNSKIADMEHRHELSCRQLRREKTQLEQKLSSIEQLTSGHATPNLDSIKPEAVDVSTEANFPQEESTAVKDLQTQLQSEQQRVCALEQQLREAEEHVKAVEETWSNQHKEVDSLYQDKCHELTQLQEKHTKLDESTAKIISALEEQLTSVKEILAGTAQSLEEARSKQDQEADSLYQGKCHELSELQGKYEQLEQSTTSTITSLEEQLASVRQTLAEAEKSLEEITSEQDKEADSLYRDKCQELNELQAKYSSLEESTSRTIATLEEQLTNVRQTLADTDNALDAARHDLAERETGLQMCMSQMKNVQGEMEDLKKLTSATQAAVIELESTRKNLSEVEEKLRISEAEKTEAVDHLNDELTKRTTQLLEAKDMITEKVAEIGCLQKDLEVERATKSQLEDSIAHHAKKLLDLKAEIAEEKEKSAKLESDLEDRAAEAAEARDDRKKADEEVASHVASISTYKRQLEAVQKEVSIMKEQVEHSDEREKVHEEQLASSAQLVKDLQERVKARTADLEKAEQASEKNLKDELSRAENEHSRRVKQLEAELTDKEQKLQSRYATIDSLVEKMETERAGFELALRDARSNEAVIEKLRETLKEQEKTMQTQDRVMQERDLEVQTLKSNLAHSESTTKQSEGLKDQMREKDMRIRELEREVQRAEKSRANLEHDTRDITAELKTCERNLSEQAKELADAKQELAKLKSEEDASAKTLAKDIVQRDAELSKLRGQLQTAEEERQRVDKQMDGLLEKCRSMQAEKAKKETELAKWREERDHLVAQLEHVISEKDSEIQQLKQASKTATGTRRGGRSLHPSKDVEDDSSAGAGKEIESLNRKLAEGKLEIEKLERAVEVKDQTIADLREQHLQLQQQLAVSAPDVPKATSRKSRIPAKSRVTTNQNPDVSMGVLADSGNVVDLDDTVTVARQRQSTFQTSETAPRATRGRKRTTGVGDLRESEAHDLAERSPARNLRSRPRRV